MHNVLACGAKELVALHINWQLTRPSQIRSKNSQTDNPKVEKLDLRRACRGLLKVHFNAINALYSICPALGPCPERLCVCAVTRKFGRT